MGPEEYAGVVKILRRVDPVAVYLFGSQARGRTRTDSDVDLAIVLPPGGSLTAIERMDLVVQLEKITERQVDLLVLNHAPLPLQFEVISTGIVLYQSSNDARTDFEDLVVRDYLDLGPMLERSRQEILEEARGASVAKSPFDHGTDAERASINCSLAPSGHPTP